MNKILLSSLTQHTRGGDDSKEKKGAALVSFDSLKLHFPGSFRQRQRLHTLTGTTQAQALLFLNVFTDDSLLLPPIPMAYRLQQNVQYELVAPAVFS
jgi:hypothetical protein